MLMNRYSYSQDHGIAFHQDTHSAYDEKDPITSLSMVNGSLLLVSTKKARKGNNPKYCLVIYQPVNSMLIMSGKFQSQMLHGVPSYKDMKELAKCSSGDCTSWSYGDSQQIKILWYKNSRRMLNEELQRLDRLNLGQVENERWNVTLRWFRKHLHQQCPHHLKQVAALSTQLKSVASDSRRPLKSVSSEIRGSQSSAAPAWDAEAAKQGEIQAQETARQRKNFDPVSSTFAARAATAPPQSENEVEAEPTHKQEMLIAMQFMSSMLLPECYQRAAALFTAHTEARRQRHRDLVAMEHQLNQLDGILKSLVEKKILTPKEGESLQDSVIDKMNSISRQRVLLELLWLDVEGPGFFSCSEHVSRDLETKNQKHLDRIIMSFSSFQNLLRHNAIMPEYLLKHGWLCLNFDVFQAPVLMGSGTGSNHEAVVEGQRFVEFFDLYGIFNPRPRGHPRMSLRMSFVSSALLQTLKNETQNPTPSMRPPVERLTNWFCLWLDHVETREQRSLQDFTAECQIILWVCTIGSKMQYLQSRQETRTGRASHGHKKQRR